MEFQKRLFFQNLIIFFNLNIDMKSIIGDIRDYNFIEKVNLFKPNIIFHLAAQNLKGQLKILLLLIQI